MSFLHFFAFLPFSSFHASPLVVYDAMLQAGGQYGDELAFNNFSRGITDTSFPTSTTASTQITNNVMTSSGQRAIITSNWNPSENTWTLRSGSNTTQVNTKKKDDKKDKKKEEEKVEKSSLAEDLKELETLWEVLSECLEEFDRSGDANAFLIVQNAVEAFFMVHSLDKKEAEMKRKKLEEQEKEEGDKSKEAGEKEKVRPDSGKQLVMRKMVEFRASFCVNCKNL